MKMGQRVADKITGFQGVITGCATYITGCTQYLLQPRVKENGDAQDGRWFDEDRLEVIEATPISLTVKKSGPDMPAPIR